MGRSSQVRCDEADCISAGEGGSVGDYGQADVAARRSRLAKEGSARRQWVGSIGTDSPVAGRIQPRSVRRHTKASAFLRWPMPTQSSTSMLKGAVAIGSHSLMTRPAPKRPLERGNGQGRRGFPLMSVKDNLLI